MDLKGKMPNKVTGCIFDLNANIALKSYNCFIMLTVLCVFEGEKGDNPSVSEETIYC